MADEQRMADEDSRPVQREPIDIYWLKRDLRTQDNAALAAAIHATRKPHDPKLLILYTFEPSLLSNPHYDRRHWRFVTESLEDLASQLASCERASTTRNDFSAGPLYVFCREMIDVLRSLEQRYVLRTLYSHEETGLRITYDRDKTVTAFCKIRGLKWREFPTNATIRRMGRDVIWARRYDAMVGANQHELRLTDLRPVRLPAEWFAVERGEALPSEWRVRDTEFQPGGELAASDCLESFVTDRVDRYRASVSRPFESREGCSRLSPYIAWGCLSIRQVYQAQDRAKVLAKAEGSPRAKDLALFTPRLRWQGMFIQAFESDDRIEFENTNAFFRDLEKSVNPEHYSMWAQGVTGYPLVDACMRSLIATGYVNFRMRALLISFLTHHLFQDWREGAQHLARVFTDFEPGLHYGQIQMQSGMGNDAVVRVYNPIKQSYDHDPDGTFIRLWVPELAKCPHAFIHEPWRMSADEQRRCGIEIGRSYPAPIIDIVETGRHARARLARNRNQPNAPSTAQRLSKASPREAEVPEEASS